MDELKSKVIMFHLPIVGRFIVIGDANVARYVLMGNSEFVKSPTYSTLLPLIGRKSLVTMEGDEWSVQRKSYNPGFSPDFLRDVVSTVISKCRRFVDVCDVDARDGNSTNMLDRAIDLTIDVIVSVGFGEDWRVSSAGGDGGATTDDGRVSTMRQLTSLIGESMKDPLKRYFNLVHIWKTWRLSSSLDRDMRDLVTRRLDELSREGTDAPASSVDGSETAKRRDILSLTLSRFLKQQSKVGDTSPPRLGPIEMEIITSQLKTFYFAGHDTTATTIAWAYWLLIRHPECLRKAREEVETHIGLEPLVDGTTYEMLQKCAYLDAVSRETLRLYPPAATTRYVPSSTARDDGIADVPNSGGYLLGDSIVHLNFYAIQRDPDEWDEPNEFVPERFLGDIGRKRISSSSFLPFSKGARDCIGKYFALLEIKIALAALICRYDGDAIDADEAYVARLTSIPRGGCKVNLRRRIDT
jgi:cytochrome P450